jgi:glycerol uptake facilitator protein
MIDKKNLATLLAEFLGTAVLTLVVLSVKNSAIGIPYFVAIAAGLTVGVAYVAAGDISKIQMNPAVTLALWTVRKVKTIEGILRIVFQLLGAFVALKVFGYFINTTVQNVAGHYSARVMIAEAVGALIFTLAIGAAMYKKLDGINLGLVVGGAFALAIVVAASASNGLINPALALGIKSWSWGTYVLGPVVGAVVGANLYMVLFTDSTKSKSKK